MERRGFLGALVAFIAAPFTLCKVFGKSETPKLPIPDLRGDKAWRTGKGCICLSENNFIDLSPTPNRISKYKGYEALRNIPEVERAVTLICDFATNPLFPIPPELTDKIREQYRDICSPLPFCIVISGDDALRKEITSLFEDIKLKCVKFWQLCMSTTVYGDAFVELILDPNDPKQGLLGFQQLAPDSMYRIETVKGKLVEFQQSKEGPDYLALNIPIDHATEKDLMRSVSIDLHQNKSFMLELEREEKHFIPTAYQLWRT